MTHGDIPATSEMCQLHHTHLATHLKLHHLRGSLHQYLRQLQHRLQTCLSRLSFVPPYIGLLSLMSFFDLLTLVPRLGHRQDFVSTFHT